MLILKLILIGGSLFFVILYQFQRSENKANLNETLNSQEPIRQLEEEEYQLLLPYLETKKLVKPYKYCSSLVSKDVYLIGGSCVRESLTTNGALSSYYFTIGGIEVFFPYGIENYTSDNNIAEVVFTENYAFVISLNGFSLADAKEGVVPKELDDTQELDDEEIPQQEDQDTIESIESNNHKTIEQRETTPFESPPKNRFYTNFCVILFCLLAVYFVIFYTDVGFSWLLIASGVCVIIAMIAYFYKTKNEIQTVHHIRGAVEGKNEDNHTLSIGKRLLVNYPKYWHTILPEKTSIDADIDVIIDGEQAKLIRYGHSLSLAKENEKYGFVKSWKRNSFYTIAGIVLLYFLFSLSPSLQDDIQFTHKWLTNQTKSWSIDDETALKHSAIQKGDWLEINLDNASCHTDEYDTNLCQKVIINNNRIDITDMIKAIPKWINEESHNTLVVTKHDDQVEVVEKYAEIYSKLMNRNSSNYYDSNKKVYTKLMNLNKLIMIIDSTCYTDNSTCSSLKQIFTQLFTNDKEYASWQEVVSHAKDIKQQRVDKIISIKTADNIEHLFKKLSNQFFYQQEQALSERLQQFQQEDNSISLILVNDNINVKIQDKNLVNPFNEEQQRFLYYYQILSLGAGHVNLGGLVSEITYRDNGAIKRLSINSDARYQLNNSHKIPTFVIYAFLMNIIMIVTLLQIGAWLYKVFFNRRRIKRILADYHTHHFY